MRAKIYYLSLYEDRAKGRESKSKIFLTWNVMKFIQDALFTYWKFINGMKPKTGWHGMDKNRKIISTRSQRFHLINFCTMSTNTTKIFWMSMATGIGQNERSDYFFFLHLFFIHICLFVCLFFCLYCILLIFVELPIHFIIEIIWNRLRHTRAHTRTEKLKVRFHAFSSENRIEIYLTQSHIRIFTISKWWHRKTNLMCERFYSDDMFSLIIYTKYIYGCGINNALAVSNIATVCIKLTQISNFDLWLIFSQSIVGCQCKMLFWQQYELYHAHEEHHKYFYMIQKIYCFSPFLFNQFCFFA